MHAHDHADDESALRPRQARTESLPTAAAFRAAASGRPEVLGTAGILGLQRTVGNSGVSSLLEEERSPVHDVIGSGGGSPLPADLRQEMQGRLGHDFSDVRLHTDSAAHESAQAVNAQAYTVGTNVVFQRDKYDPASTEGKTMLAHELTHVVQQRQGPVDGSSAPGGVQISDPGDRFEREAAATASAAMAGPVGPQFAGAAGASSAGSAQQVQREAAPEDEEEQVQTFVQRAEVGEEEEELPM